MNVVEGTIAFSNVLTEDEWKGAPVGYNVTITLDSEEADKLSDMGVKLKEYEGKYQRKFKSKFDIDVLDADGNALELSEELPRGSKVRLLWAKGGLDKTHGLTTYLSKVKVLELGQPEEITDF
jgi:hypothetical protein